jgi:2'-5' RNA ligase
MPSRASFPNTQDEGPQLTLFDTSVKVWRYLLIIRPSNTLVQEVARMKGSIAERIGPFKNERALAHITLVFAYVPEVHERDLCDGIAQGVHGHPPFDLRLQGFGHFPDKRTIHLDVLDKEPIVQLRNSVLAHLRAYTRLNGLGIHPTAATRLIIAKLGPVQFENAWNCLPQRHEHLERVDTLYLLRGDQRAGGGYDQVRAFPLTVNTLT